MKKILRSISRDNRGAAMGSGLFGILGAFIGSTFSPELGVAMVGASSAVGVGVGKFAQYLGEEEGWTWNFDLSKNSCVINDQKIVGKRSDLKKIIRVQQAINRISKKYQTINVLPEHAQQKILEHVRDVQPLLEKCNVYEERSWNVLERKKEMNFVRQFYNEQGTTETQVLVSVELQTRAEALEKFRPAVLPSLETQKLQAEFDAAAKLEQAKEQTKVKRKLHL